VASKPIPPAAPAPDREAWPSPWPRLSLRPAEAAEVLGISERLLWQETNRGAIPHLRIGSKVVVYPVAALREWLADNAAKGVRK
jgi:predicted DNA-binding transcriptional regulator AlpA